MNASGLEPDGTAIQPRSLALNPLQAIWIGEHQVIPGHPEGQSNGQTSSDKSGEYAAFGAS
jgi:hypothetical protein